MASKTNKPEMKENLEGKLKSLEKKVWQFVIGTTDELNSGTPILDREGYDKNYKSMISSEFGISALLYLGGFLLGMNKPWSQLPKYLKYTSYAVGLDFLVRSAPNVVVSVGGDCTDKRVILGSYDNHPGIIGRGREIKERISKVLDDYRRKEAREESETEHK